MTWNNFLLSLDQFFSAVDFKLWSGKIFLIIIILLLTRVAIYLADLLIERTFQMKIRHGKVTFDERRLNTLKTLLKSVIRYVFFFLAVITILDELGVPITAVLSAAGILGLAVGFGAQNLVRDIITGFFILFEDQFSVGEYIETEGIGGTVEEVGLRITKLRDWGGQLHIIPNGKIGMVTNHHRGSLRAMVEVGISYEENLDKVIQVLEDLCKKVSRDFAKVITQEPKVVGVQALGNLTVLIRIVAMTIPLEQWGLERELRKRIKETFEREGIQIPYPHRVVVPVKGEGS